MSRLQAPGFPAHEVRRRARTGRNAAFAANDAYGEKVFGAIPGNPGNDILDAAQLVPPVFVPHRLEKLIELGQEPLHTDVDLATTIGGFSSPLPVYVSAFGSTQVASGGLGPAVAAQAGRLGLPMVIGENIVPVQGYGRLDPDAERALLERIRRYMADLPDGLGGVVVQQSTEDADAEVWNLVYSDPSAQPLLESGRLGFELKVGQGAKPGLGGITLVDNETAARISRQYALEPVGKPGTMLRFGSPGTFTEEILTQQIRLMRNNYPRARIWVKLTPARDIAQAAAVAWAAGADAVTVDGAEAGTGWAPTALLQQVGLPLGECLQRIGSARGTLLASGRMWEGTRAAKAIALGATAVGLGRAALLAADEDRERGLVNLVDCLAFELGLLTSSVGKYSVGKLAVEDLWVPPVTGSVEEDPALDLRLAREQTLDELRDYLSGTDFEGATECAFRLRKELVSVKPLPSNVVLVAYGGGKDSAYTLAFVRAMQLMLDRVYGETFQMRVVTMRHAGVPYAVMRNIQRSYSALRLLDDPSCELVLVDGNDIVPFDVDRPLPVEVVRRNRIDVLMTGHRTFGDGRPTFCNACNISVANSFGIAASHGGGVDVIITGDSPQEQRSYGVWIQKLARKFGLQPQRERRAGFPGVLTTLDNIGQAYFTEIHGEDAAALADRRVATGVPERLMFFSIYDDTTYTSGDHWSLLTDYLKFEFDETAFNFTESDCGNPMLMAHLRALKCERVYGRTYAEGLAEYVDFAVGLMRRKEIPESLIDIVLDRYRGEAGVRRMRAIADDYAHEVFGLPEEQLVCMVYSPFANQAEGLDDYLAREQPELAGQAGEIRELLANPTSEDGQLAKELERITGLEVSQLRVIYGAPMLGQGNGLLPAILHGDPHRAVIDTRHSPEGPAVKELISGR